MPLILLGIALVLLIVYGPSIWARVVLSRHSDERPYFPGSAGELARHLLDEAGLQEVDVEGTDRGDHYDPADKAVRLKHDNLNSRSLTAIVTAAHEVGHAVQDRDGYLPLRTRTKLVPIGNAVSRIASIVFTVTLLLTFATFSPVLAILGGIAAIAGLLVNVVIHLVTLPVEYDASFNRALPVLEGAGYVPPEDVPAARQILHACALTYVAAALANMLNLARWIRLLR